MEDKGYSVGDSYEGRAIVIPERIMSGIDEENLKYERSRDKKLVPIAIPSRILKGIKEISEKGIASKVE